MKTKSMDKKPDMEMMMKHGECDPSKVCPDCMAPSMIEEDPINGNYVKSIEIGDDSGARWE